MEKLVNIIDDLSFDKCKYVIENLSLKGGNNGPYHDPETELRVSAHWIYTFSYEYRKTGNEQYLEAIKILANNICSHQENNNTFLCRTKDGKDKINGSIGTAWIIEGLIAAASVCNEEKYYESAVRAFLAQPFDDKIGLWKRREIDDKILSYDGTYNHQLWLAASGAQICAYRLNKDIEKCVISFLDHSKHTFHSYSNGLAHHFVFFNKPLKRAIKSRKNLFKQNCLQKMKRPCYKYKEEGYHNFSVYAFAILHHYYPDHSFFQCAAFKRALAYCLDFQNSFALGFNDKTTDGTGVASKFDCDCNVFGFSYNSPAFEMPFIVREFSSFDFKSEIDELIERQIEINYDPDKHSFCRNTEDAITLDARVYEFVRGIE